VGKLDVSRIMLQNVVPVPSSRFRLHSVRQNPARSLEKQRVSIIAGPLVCLNLGEVCVSGSVQGGRVSVNAKDAIHKSCFGYESLLVCGSGLVDVPRVNQSRGWWDADPSTFPGGLLAFRRYRTGDLTITNPLARG
jgi:hypothetical protein